MWLVADVVLGAMVSKGKRLLLLLALTQFEIERAAGGSLALASTPHPARAAVILHTQPSFNSGRHMHDIHITVPANILTPSHTPSHVFSHTFVKKVESYLTKLSSDKAYKQDYIKLWSEQRRCVCVFVYEHVNGCMRWCISLGCASAAPNTTVAESLIS